MMRGDTQTNVPVLGATRAGLKFKRITRQTYVWRLLFSPAMALALSIPTVGYYTFATYSSLMGAQSSAPAIAYRAFSLIFLLAVFISGWWHRSKLPKQALPGLLFLTIYLLRMLENVVVQNIDIPPGNNRVFLTFLAGGILPSVLLASLSSGFSNRHLRLILSFFAVVFSVGALLMISRLDATAASARLGFEKVNPIALAYVGSTFILFYLVIAQKSRRAAIEAAVVVPILLFIALQAQSRGMMLSTTAVVLIYFLLLRGDRKVAVFAVVGVFSILTYYLADPAIFQRAIGSISRIDTVNDLSTAMRALSFRGAYQQFFADPILGRWVSEQYTGYYPHNIYLESLMAVGLIGSIPFIIHIYFSCVAAISIIRLKSENWVWTFVALLFLREAIGSAASGSIWGNVNFWISSFVVISFWYVRYIKIRPKPDGEGTPLALS
jgi:hypothetical protein